MKNFKVHSFVAIVLLSIFFSSCGDCCIDPDLISDLSTPTTDIITGEPVDWDYVVTSVEDNSQECDIIQTIVSVGKIVVDYFLDETDSQGDLILNSLSDIGKLDAGQSQEVVTNIVFNEDGIYMLAVNADDTNVVEERNEDNNDDFEDFDTRSSSQDDLFKNASSAFMEKLQKASAIVIVGDSFNGGIKVNSYKGKPIYYAQ